MSKVVTTFVSDDKELSESIDKMNRKLNELQTNAASSKGASGFASMAAGASRFAGAIGTAVGILEKLNGELEHRNELERKHLDLQKSASGSERGVFMHF